MLVKISDDLIINEADIATLKKYDIDAYNYKNIRELQLAIERYIDDSNLEDSELDELDYIEESLQDSLYYYKVNK